MGAHGIGETLGNSAAPLGGAFFHRQEFFVKFPHLVLVVSRPHSVFESKAVGLHLVLPGVYQEGVLLGQHPATCSYRPTQEGRFGMTGRVVGTADHPAQTVAHGGA